jgi:predicted branched-subunit amino acid permease
LFLPMRSHFSRPAFFEGVRDMTPALIGIVPFGMVCGIGSLAAGVSPLETMAMAAIMFSGSAQIVATQLLAAGAPLLVIVLSCLVVGLRFLVYSAAMAPYLRPLDPRWRNVLSFVLSDQAFASTIHRFRESGDLAANASYFLGGGALLWVVWQIAELAGILVGQMIPASWQLEFVVPLCFLAVLAPLLRDRVTLLVVAVAAAAVIALDAMPMRLSMICAGLIGIAAGALADTMRERHE